MKELISVIIPAYNEAPRIAPTLEKAHQYLRNNFGGFEIVVVDDGSTDDTASVVQAIGTSLGHINLIQHRQNSGKGYAVKKGVLASKGDLLLACDADMSTPIEEIGKLLPYIRREYDIAIGSRGLQQSDIVVRQPWYREGMGKTFNLIVRVLVFGGIKDTQCGFKLFRGDAARKLFAISLIKGFSFDVEILFLAKKAGFKIQEVPIKWLNSPDSRVRIFKDSMRMFLEILNIRAFWMLGRYRIF